MRTQLCLGLAALAVHVPSERWGEGGVVRWFAYKFNALPPDLALPCMLELLTVLPQVGARVRAGVWGSGWQLMCPHGNVSGRDGSCAAELVGWWG